MQKQKIQQTQIYKVKLLIIWFKADFLVHKAMCLLPYVRALLLIVPFIITR